ncbi:MAG: hypothetical protein D8M58_03745 [Calditrichaeota bacterium]|nr:MAG: hypothetical protein DWQ03_03330 [Calditrichota bacterium]MBL1204480.1 hypothetical protein [Calditrichota bacterium]NOG44309.1 hypothetical protein [Calditrichota bacterium]
MNNYKRLLNSIIIFIACTFLLISCSNESQPDIKKDVIVDVMTELMAIEHLAISDSLKAVKISKIMQTYKIEIDSLKSIIKKLEQEPEYWHSVYNSIKNQLNESNSRKPSNK